MIWIDENVRYLFQVFVNEIFTLHESYGKIKHQTTYRHIADTLIEAIDLLFQEKRPENADVSVSSISGIVQTQLGVMASKKLGKENTIDFVRKYASTTTALSKFTQAYNHYLRDQFLHPVNVLEEKKDLNTALTHLDEPDVLHNKIRSLYHLPLRAIDNHCFSLFKRAATHQPKKMAISGLTGGLCITIAILSTLDHTIGPKLDAFLRKNNLHLEYKDLLILTLFVAALFTLTASLANSYQKPPRPEKREEEMTVLIEDETADEKTKLMAH